MILWNN